MADDAVSIEPIHVPPVPKPDHVPDHLVYDFDKYSDPELRDNPHKRFLRLLKEAPEIFWTPHRGGHWMAAGYEAVFEASRDWETFSSEMIPREMLEAMKAAMPAGAPHIPELAPITADPPVHTMYRLPLNPAFSPKRMNLLKDEIRALARELIAKIAPLGHCEFISTVAEPLPVQIFLKTLGMPLEGLASYRALIKDSASNGLTGPEKQIETFGRAAALMRPVIEERRKNPKDDLISLLWASELDGRPPTSEDIEDTGVMLFLAGLDTVINGIGLGVHHLAENTDLQNQLRADPSRIGAATEELLRRYTFTVPTRSVLKDVEFRGIQFKKGDVLNLLLGAADLDSTHFENPAKVDIDREAVHVAFGVGPHRCLGSHLARLELQILYEELLAGIPTFRLERPSKFHGGHVIGPDFLYLAWDA